MGRLALIILSLLFATEAHAVSLYWVDTDGGAANWAACESDTEPADASHCTFAMMNNNIKSGQTAYIQGGTYNASGVSIKPLSGGAWPWDTSGITIMSVPGETAIIDGTNNGEIDMIDINNMNYITLRDLTVRNAQVRWLDVDTASHIIIDNCVFDTPKSGESLQNLTSLIADADNVQLLNSTFDLEGYDVAEEVDSLAIVAVTSSLIKGNTFRYSTHGLLEGTLGGGSVDNNYIAIIGNTFYNPWEQALVMGRPNGHHILISGNTVHGVSTSCTTDPFEPCDSFTRANSGIYLHKGQDQTIVRENILYDNDVHISFWMNNADQNDAWIYHNTGYKAVKHPAFSTKQHFQNSTAVIMLSDTADDNFAGNFFGNNIFWKSEHKRQIIGYVSGAGQAASGNTITANLIADSEVSQWVTWQGGTATPNSITWQNANSSDGWSDNLSEVSGQESNLNPNFVDPDGTSGNSDFNVNSGSTVIDRGVGLTETNGTGTNSQVITLHNVSFIFSGGNTPWNIPGDVTTDTIYSPTADGGFGSCTVSGITPALKQVRCDETLSWSTGVSVFHRVYQGSAPDLGAFEFTAAAAASPGGTITFGGSGTISFGGDGVMQ